MLHALVRDNLRVWIEAMGGLDSKKSSSIVGLEVDRGAYGDVRTQIDMYVLVSLRLQCSSEVLYINLLT